MTERNVTDVISEIERKVDLCLSHLSTLDLNFKLILNRMKGQPEPVVQMTAKIESSIQTVRAPGLPSAEPGSDIKPPKPKKVKEAAVDLDQGAKAVPVEQKVIYPNGEPVRLGKVRIKNSEGKVVKETMTNHPGNWSALLLPGIYTVYVSREALPMKPKIDLECQITVTQSGSSIKLPSLGGSE